MSTSTMQAIRIKSLGQAALGTAPIPQLRDDYILVKTKAVAINPADWKSIDYIATPGETVGCDYSGVVVQVGALLQDHFRPGDRVAGLVHGCNASNHADGAFAEFVIAKGDLQMKIPHDMSFETAATLGAGITTVGQNLYQSLALPLPQSEASDNYVLIYGGSTATGSLAIQFAKLSGLQVVTTCSPSHGEWLRKLGADHVFNYKSPTCAADIQSITGNKLAYVFDTTGTMATAQICSDAIGHEGGIYTSLEPVAELPRSDVVNKNTMVFSAIGENFQIGGIDVPANALDHDFAVKFAKIAGELLMQGKLVAHPVSHQKGGLEKVLEGVDMMRRGSVSGVKLVYTISDS
ncbi:Ff.00g020460.m01.CDS01 [Fusarium sp. VM40]|nr:Ff.00g020460.m01.CDS01 [Fusarium sp. VM40]